MNRQRIKYLETHADAKLTKEEVLAGWVFCCEFDGMLLNRLEDNPESECCTCKYDEEKIKEAFK